MCNFIVHLRRLALEIALLYMHEICPPIVIRSLLPVIEYGIHVNLQLCYKMISHLNMHTAGVFVHECPDILERQTSHSQNTLQAV